MPTGRSLATSARGGGGRRKAPVPAPSTPMPAPVSTAQDPSIDSVVRGTYGYLSAYLDHPEIGPILRQAAQEGWDAARLQGAISKTQWWQTTSASARKWDLLRSSDPATAAQALSEKALAVRDAAGTLGLSLAPDRISQIAETALRLGWTAPELQDALAREVDYGKLPPGTALSTRERLGALAKEYAVPLSDQSLNQWTSQILTGQVDEKGYQSYLTEQAKSLFPSLAGALDRGVTVRQYAEPYLQVAAKNLSISPESVDLTDPKWSRALVSVDPKTGDRASMSLDDWQRTLRSDPAYGYQYTKNAADQAYALADHLLQSFGARA